MDKSFANLIDSAKGVLVLLPQNPDFDKVAGALALAISLSKTKEISVSCPSPMTVEFNRLIGVDKIGTDLGKKNLVITFVNFQATDIERVSYDIENGLFKLSVIPKPRLLAPTKDQLNISYAGGSFDTVILVGGEKESDFPTLEASDLRQVKILHLGTKLLETESGSQILSFAAPGSCVSELIASVIKTNGFLMNADIATNLLSGIEKASNSFQSETATSETFSVFGELLSLGGKRYKNVPNSTFPQGSVPSQPYNKPIEQVIQGQESVEIDPNKIPKSWTQPKVYTGTTVN